MRQKRVWSYFVSCSSQLFEVITWQVQNTWQVWNAWPT